MASNPDGDPQFCEVFIKSEPMETEQQQSTTSSVPEEPKSFSFEAITKEELIIEDKDDEGCNLRPRKKVGLLYRPDGTIDCEECGKNVLDYKAYLQHSRRHRNLQEGKYRCKLCKKIFADRGDLTKHNRRIHSEVKGKKGPTPEEKATQATEEDVDPESRVIEENGTFKCPECSKTFKKRILAVTHIERHDNLRKGSIKCSICGKCFACKSALLPHERAHNPATKVPAARSASPLPVMRNGFPAFKCPECNKVFDKRKPYFKHARRHNAIKKGEHQCPICGVVLGFQSELNKHLAYHELNGPEPSKSKTPYVKAEVATAEQSDLICKVCGKFVQNKFSLERHVKRHEALEKGEFQCARCGQYFSTSFALLNHERRHGEPNAAEQDSDSNKEAVSTVSSEEMTLSEAIISKTVAKPRKLILKKIIIKKEGE
ncbi:zinc finger protein 34-like [Culex pipiens pallens]|uniref:zinc finger protein 34-like n=1 Tax=Culex pipiens pallens TaxID=42434 RepID=UPI0019546211|nr:zinc finger protein 34-like [Culex pipiens pallens]